MRTLAVILLLAVACQARPEAEQPNIAEKVQQLSHTVVAAVNDVPNALGLPTQEEALNLITDGFSRIKTRLEEIAHNLTEVAEKHHGAVSEQLSSFAHSLNETFVSSTSLNLEERANQLKSSLNSLAQKWQEFSAKVQPSVDESWNSVRSIVVDAAEKTKDVTTNLHNSIQSAVQKAN